MTLRLLRGLAIPPGREFTVRLTQYDSDIGGRAGTRFTGAEAFVFYPQKPPKVPPDIKK